MTNPGRIEECQHRNTISTITAGLERVVCEECGHISVRYVESTVRLFPDTPDQDVPQITGRPDPTKPADCGVCGERAEFLIPGGAGCAEHAWKEASLQQIMGSEPWIPIAIDLRTNAG